MIPAASIRVRVWDASGKLLHDRLGEFGAVTRSGYRRAPRRTASNRRTIRRCIRSGASGRYGRWRSTGASSRNASGATMKTICVNRADNIASALRSLRDARDALAAAKCPNAADAVRRAIKSTEGAARNDRAQRDRAQGAPFPVAGETDECADGLSVYRDRAAQCSHSSAPAGEVSAFALALQRGAYD